MTAEGINGAGPDPEILPAAAAEPPQPATPLRELTATARAPRRRRSNDFLFPYDSSVLLSYDGSVALLSDNEDYPPIPAPPPPAYVLLENVPQTAYGRIRLCNTMVHDHYIPNYLIALESAMQLYLEETGLTAEDILPILAATAV